MNIPWCPVVTPSQKEFKNFYQYVEQLDRLYKKDYGMVKVPNTHLAELKHSVFSFFP